MSLTGKLICALLCACMTRGQVYGGSEMVKNPPYMVRIETSAHNIHDAAVKVPPGTCGGTILNEFWVVTAAHCFDSYSTVGWQRLDIGNSIKVFAGDVHKNKNKKSPKSRQQHISHFWTIHPSYTAVADDLVYDIALVMVLNKFEFDENVGRAQLPGPDDFLNVGDQCKVFGWGTPHKKNDDDDAKVLREGTLKVKETNVEHLKNVIELESYRNSINLTTKGDSGGPVLCNEAVFAVVSTGESNRKAFLNGSADNTHATLILPNLGWIERNINWRTPQQPIEQRESKSDTNFVVLLLNKYTGEKEHHAKCHGAAVSMQWVIVPARCLRDLSNTEELVSVKTIGYLEVEALPKNKEKISLPTGKNSVRESKTWVIKKTVGVGLVFFEQGIENLQESGSVCDGFISNDLQLTHWQMKVDDDRVTEFFSRQLKVAQVSITNRDSMENGIIVEGRNGFAPAEGILHDDRGHVVGVSYETQSMWIKKKFINVCTNNWWINDVINKDLYGLKRLIFNDVSYTGIFKGERKKRKLAGPDGEGPKCAKNAKNKSCSGFGFVSAIMKWFV